jgi:hypothetical protein
MAFSRRIKTFPDFALSRFARCAPSFSKTARGIHLVMHPWLLVAIMIAMEFGAWHGMEHGIWRALVEDESIFQSFWIHVTSSEVP